MEENLKRGKGKNIGEIKKQDFFQFYKDNAKNKIINKTIYNRFLGELLQTYSELIVREAFELKLNNLGKIRIKSDQLRLTDKDGNLSNTLKVDWGKTWEYWYNKYPELTKSEIISLEGKKVLFHDNEHTNQEIYKHIWDRMTSDVRHLNLYTFKPSRHYSRLIKQVVSDPNRKVVYYG